MNYSFILLLKHYWLVKVVLTYISVGEALSKKDKVELIMFREGGWKYGLIVRSEVIHECYWNCKINMCRYKYMVQDMTVHT